MSRQQLPCASQTQRALLGIILQFPNRLSDCDRFGINDTHFQGVELELWQEIVWAEADGRPFDINLAIKCSDIFQSSTNVMGWNNEMPAPFPRFNLMSCVHAPFRFGKKVSTGDRSPPCSTSITTPSDDGSQPMRTKGLAHCSRPNGVARRAAAGI